MNASSKEADSPTRQENANTSSAAGKGIATTSSNSPATWLRLKDPRIVRVSRAFGGKDRHSKVCTIRGLRDRRVRLSVPTAIQLYDLQERLGVNQPSKVVDWLLNAAKDEIDDLPPLPIPPGMNFGLNHHQMVALASQEASANANGNKEGTSSINWSSNLWNSENAFGRGKSKEVSETNLKRSNEEEKDQEQRMEVAAPYGSNFYHFDPSNYPLSQLGSHGFSSDHHLHGFNVASPLSLVCPPTQTFFPSSHAASSSLEIDPRQISPYHFQMLRSSSDQNSLPSFINPFYSLSQANVRPFSLNIAPRPQNNQEEKEHDDDFSSK